LKTRTKNIEKATYVEKSILANNWKIKLPCYSWLAGSNLLVTRKVSNLQMLFAACKKKFTKRFPLVSQEVSKFIMSCHFFYNSFAEPKPSSAWLSTKNELREIQKSLARFLMLLATNSKNLL
jgi:hypothetical protein